MHATLEHIGNDVVCRASGAMPAECRIDGETMRPALLALATRYDEAVRRADHDALPAVGRELLSLLDASGWASAWAGAAGARCLEIRVADPAQALAAALLDAPWELLATAHGFLADDDSQLFELTRRVGAPAQVAVPRHADLQLMFMAAAPLDVDELDFEAEEGAILQATQALPLHLVVEESGSAQPLAERLALDGPFEAIHLSCHGSIDAKRGPFLAFEDVQGAMEPAFAGDLARLLGDAQGTSLVFLSACRTAEQASSASSDPARTTEPFVRNLVRAGIHNVLGWDGSVYDTDAAAFAQSFYRELAMLARIPRAAAVARQQLRQRNLQEARQGQHWHLARLYLGAQGGGALAAKGLPKRKLASTSQTSQFLDAQRGEVPVASRLAFAGRRRPIQAVMRAFAVGSAGVLVHGMGNLGKSSLAHRVSSRMTGHHTVVVFKQYDALAILDRLLDAVPAARRQAERTTWREAVAANPALFVDAMEALLEGPFDAQPILLVIDDLERVLEKPAPEAVTASTPVQAAWRGPLAAVLAAFAKVNTPSRLLITSRYTFSLNDAQGQDLAMALTSVPLRPMAPRERIKQLRAAASPEILASINLRLADRALACADGNPGLQATLMTPLLAGEPAAAGRAIEVIEEFQRSGVAPESLDALVAQGVAQDQGNALLAFFRRMAFDVYRAALTPSQARMLACACVFEPGLPITHAAMNVAGAAVGVEMPEVAMSRLLALGLLDDWGVHDDEPAASVNPLARPLVDVLSVEETRRIAFEAVPVLARAWTDRHGSVAHDARAVELARLALLAPDVDLTTLERAAAAASLHLFRGRGEGQRALNEVLRPTLARLSGVGQLPSAAFARIAFDCSDRLGDIDIRRIALQSLAASVGADEPEKGSNLLRLAEASRTEGRMDESEQYLHQAVDHFEAARSLRDVAIARGQIADILQTRGQLDEALRIRQEEQLPVYERLGDARSKAITMGKIADMLQDRGQLDQALRIRQEEELPVYERLGDVRSKAVTMGQIADILQGRGQLDEALRIRHEEELPVYERLGDVRLKAVTMGQIADILQARGQLDEALRIRQEEQLPVYERLGDVRSKAVTMGKIADILQFRDHLDEALRIRQEEQLPVYERLGDVREKAVTMSKIADILQARGQFDEALHILQEEQLAVYERLGDVRSTAVTMGQIADILQARDQLDEALRIRQEEQLPVYERLGEVRSKAITMGQIADILQIRGQLDEALRIRQEEELPVYERLGDVRSKAVTMGQIADILQTRGQFDEALRIRQEEQLPVYERLGEVRSKAITMGKIADILQARGQIDEALRIRQEEQLPVYERLGEVRAKAITMGKIADILQIRGQFDEAMRIRQEEELPVYERLGEVRAKAVTMGQIAEILQARDQLDEALRIRQEEQLAVYERLGDARAKAITLSKIAGILQAQGQLDEALRIRQEEQLPIYEHLGDVRSKAITMGQIADILQIRGQLDEVLRIRQEEELPVYEHLGDLRAKLITIGQIADILQDRGQFDEALRIRQEEELPVYERLDDVRSKAVTMSKIADILQARGQLDEALRIRQEEQLIVYERLGDLRSKAITMGQIADILQARGQIDEALRIRQEEELPVYENLGDVHAKAVTMGQIADILQARGQLDEALSLHENRVSTFKSLGDGSGLAHVQFCIARLMLERGDHERGGIQTIYENLAEAFEISLGSGRADAIAAIGSLLAQVMAMGGLIDAALGVLAHAETANSVLGSDEGMTQVGRLREAIEARRPTV